MIESRRYDSSAASSRDCSTDLSDRISVDKTQNINPINTKDASPRVESMIPSTMGMSVA